MYWNEVVKVESQMWYRWRGDDVAVAEHDGNRDNEPRAKCKSTNSSMDNAQIRLAQQCGSNGFCEVQGFAFQQAKTTEDHPLFDNLFPGRHPRHNLHAFIPGATMLACTSRKLPARRGMSDGIPMTNVIYFNLRLK